MQQKISAEPQKIRHPTLAGMLYPGNTKDLKTDLASFFNATVTSVTNSFGILVQHAGYTYSGKTASGSFANISADFSGTFVILAPSHQALPTSVSDFIWKVPSGKAYADLEFISVFDLPIYNDCAKHQENSIEVQILFIVYRFPNAKIVPILLGEKSRTRTKRVADAVCRSIAKTGIRPVIIASGDCSHYVPKENLAAICNLDTIGFYHARLKHQPTMCGYGCISAMADICKYLGVHEARVFLYTTSGDITGDFYEVVGYCSMEII